MIGRNSWTRSSFCSSRRCRCLPVVIDMIFDLTRDIVLSIFEFADATAETTHQFGNFLTTKQQQYYKYYQNNMRTTE